MELTPHDREMLNIIRSVQGLIATYLQQKGRTEADAQVRAIFPEDLLKILKEMHGDDAGL